MNLTSDLQGHVTNQLAISNYLAVGTVRFFLELLQSGSTMGEIAPFQFFSEGKKVENLGAKHWAHSSERLCND